MAYSRCQGLPAESVPDGSLLASSVIHYSKKLYALYVQPKCRQEIRRELSLGRSRTEAQEGRGVGCSPVVLPCRGGSGAPAHVVTFAEGKLLDMSCCVPFCPLRANRVDLLFLRCPKCWACTLARPILVLSDPPLWRRCRCLKFSPYGTAAVSRSALLSASHGLGSSLRVQ